ncbi:MAG TPA: AmmeMemoRadiSam system protein B [Candidatus Omnitrophota bacterium]|nr:AmmeMemoRadiSam system protein B [Candidatus Omnitrophota bacterium]
MSDKTRIAVRKIQFFYPLVLIFFWVSMAYADQLVKKPNVSGQFYSADPKALSHQIDEFLKKVDIQPSEKRVEVVIVPHAGYVYSGAVAAYAYKAASKTPYRTIVVIAPSHHVGFAGASVWPQGSFETPLGSIPVDQDFATDLIARSKEFEFVPTAFAKEHSLEVQLPFLQKVFADFKIVPIVMGQPGIEGCALLAKALRQTIGDRQDVLIVISTDMSHYHSAHQAKNMDQKAIRLVQELNVQEFWEGCATKAIELCGFLPVATAMLYAKDKGLQVDILRYADSGDVSGDKQAVVGYFSAVFVASVQDKGSQRGIKDELTKEQKQKLLEVARKTIFAHIQDGKVFDVKEKDPRLLQEEGAFVTLHKHGRLRGCIGNIFGRGPLIETVRDMAIASATQDPRFRPVSKDELRELEVEISVLSKPWRIKDPEEITLGVHGVIVSRGPFNKGLFLPQVATEQGWTKEQFLSYLCSEKAGLPANAWKDPSVTLEIFSAQVFSEKDFP